MTCPPHDFRPSPEYGTPVCSKCNADADVSETPLLCSSCRLMPARWGGLCEGCRYKAELAAGTEDDRWAARWQGWVA